jgi:hypothetical protein
MAGMQQKGTEELIAELGRTLQPVRPLRAPALRALTWFALVGLPLALVVAHYARPQVFLARAADPRQAIGAFAALATGIVAVFAAFQLSIPDRSQLWRYVPLAPLALWIASSGLGCLAHGLGLGPPGERLGESTGCFVFILLASAPLSTLMLLALRRARPLEPLAVALTATLGVAALVAFVLEFFHPFDSTVIDLLSHFAAVATLVGLGAAARRLLGRA